MRKQRKLGRGVAVVGAGMSKFGMFKDKDSRDLFVEAYEEMLSSVDKGIDPKDIQAMWIGNFSNDFYVHQAHWGPIIADLLGHTPKPVTRTEGACASSTLAFRDAVFAIASGFYDIAVADVDPLAALLDGQVFGNAGVGERDQDEVDRLPGFTAEFENTLDDADLGFEDAAGPDYSRRGPGRGSYGYAPGHEHRSSGLHVDHPRKFAQ